MKKKLLASIILVVSSTSVLASKIVVFGDPDLMNIYPTDKSTVAVTESITLPAPPVEIVKTSGDRYAFLINNKIHWVSGIDVETSDRVKIESLCGSTQLATDYKSSHYGIRGAGAGCEK